MRYTEVIFELKNWEEYQKDLFIAELGDIGFDTFDDTENGFKAYIISDRYDQQTLENAIASPGLQDALVYSVHDVEEQNWNVVWESNFEPLLIRDQCYVRASFHEPHPGYPYELVIEPKMAFGTGHHETTSLMISFLLDEDVKDKSVLDMGCGTGILAILADKMEAAEVLAIDYDPVCLESTLENSKINHSKNLTALCGSKEVIPSRQFNLILANINRNILLDQLAVYSQSLPEQGLLYMSGYYKPDLEILISAGKNLDLHFIEHRQQGEWVAAKFIKKFTS